MSTLLQEEITLMATLQTTELVDPPNKSDDEYWSMAMYRASDLYRAQPHMFSGYGTWGYTTKTREEVNGWCVEMYSYEEVLRWLIADGQIWLSEVSRQTLRGSPLDNFCQHTYKHYQGFTESYNYCTKCDEKENKHE